MAVYPLSVQHVHTVSCIHVVVLLRFCKVKQVTQISMIVSQNTMKHINLEIRHLSVVGKAL